MPATHGRYFSIQLIDFWTNAFDYIGTRTTGSAAGAFAITPPGWHGRLPHGVQEIRATTKRLLALVRTEVNNPADLAAAQAIQTSYTTGPLSQYPRQRVSPVVAAQALDIFAPLPLTGFDVSLFEQINSLIQEYPPLPRDAEYARRLRPVGVDVRCYQRPGASLAGVLQAAIAPAIGAIEVAIPALLTQTSTGWSVNYDVTPVTHDPLRRAALTIYGPGTHINSEALYFSAAAVDGVALTGANDYTLTFPAGKLQASRGVLVADPLRRHDVLAGREPYRPLRDRQPHRRPHLQRRRLAHHRRQQHPACGPHGQLASFPDGRVSPDPAHLPPGTIHPRRRLAPAGPRPVPAKGLSTGWTERRGPTGSGAPLLWMALFRVQMACGCARPA